MADPGWSHPESPFHRGEQELQARLGVKERMETFARRGVRDYMPDQHRQFFAQLPFLVVGATDRAGRPWATLLAGRPGFIGSPDPRTLRVDARPLPGDPVADALTAGAQLGLLGLEFASRRRNRLNGQVAATDPAGFTLTVGQSFGNCPQYIQTRSFAFARDADAPFTPPRQRLEELDDEARALIARSDAFFIATSSGDAVEGAAAGVDVSHRGGKRGFVRIDGDGTLTVPDFAGNLHFNTLGNLLLDPRAGLVFVDFATGELLQLTGRVEIVWEGPEVAAFQGAERLWRFRIEEGVRLREALPLRWSFGDFSPNSLITGDWDSAAATLEAEALRDTWRPFRVARVMDESAVIRSFHLEPADGKEVSGFAPGQHLPIRVRRADAGKPDLRTYTISQAPSDPGYRLSIKREDAGTVSRHMHLAVREGDLIEAMAPRGGFTFDASVRRPAVLLSGGVGITPMLAMLRHAIFEGKRTRYTRPIWFVHSARDGASRAFLEEVRALQAEAPDKVHVHWALSDPEPDLKPGKDFQSKGRVGVELFKELLPFDDYDWYLCGPPAFMQALYDGLRGLNVPDKRIHAEAFGPASMKRRPDADAPPAPVDSEVGRPAATRATVVFTAAGKEAVWTPDKGTILDLAESIGLQPDFSCRSGVCGTCAVHLTGGQISYAEEPGALPGPNRILACQAVPAAGSERVAVEI